MPKSGPQEGPQDGSADAPPQLGTHGQQVQALACLSMPRRRRRRRALMVGLGHMGSMHARVLSQMEGVELAAAVDPDVSRRDRFGRRYSDVSLHDSLETALDQ